MAKNLSAFLFDDFVNLSHNDMNNYFYENTPLNRISEVFLTIMEYYSIWHSQLSIVVCSIGLLTNSLSIFVLTSKNIRSPSNTILTALASSDWMKLFVYLIITTQEDIAHSMAYLHTYLHMLWANMAMTLHVVSTSLTVTLVIFRYLTINFVGRGIQRYNNKLALKCILLSSSLSIALCFPAYFVYTVEKAPAVIETQHDQQLYFVKLQNNEILIDCNFWIQTIILKLFPCAIITIFSTLTIKRIINNKFRLSQKTFLRRVTTRQERMRKRQSNTTSIMLLLVILLFLICEAPKVILLCMSGLNRILYYEMYLPVGDLLDFITMVNGSANFVLFCCMNRKFRQTIANYLKFPFKRATSRERNSPAVRAELKLNEPTIKETQV